MIIRQKVTAAHSITPSSVRRKSNRVKWALSLSIVAAAGYVAPYAVYHCYYFSAIQSKNSNASLVVVCTGSQGRLTYALENLRPHQTLLITGVSEKFDFKALCKKEGIDTESLQLPNIAYLKYGALDTAGNAIEVKRFLEKHPEHTDVLIVSSGSHLARVHVEMNKLLGKEYRLSYAASDTTFSPLNLNEIYKTAWRSCGGPTFRQPITPTNNPGHQRGFVLRIGQDL